MTELPDRSPEAVAAVVAGLDIRAKQIVIDIMQLAGGRTAHNVFSGTDIPRMKESERKVHYMQTYLVNRAIGYVSDSFEKPLPAALEDAFSQWRQLNVEYLALAKTSRLPRATEKA